MIHYVKYVISVGEHEGMQLSHTMTKSDIEKMQREGTAVFEYISGPIHS